MPSMYMYLHTSDYAPLLCNVNRPAIQPLSLSLPSDRQMTRISGIPAIPCRNPHPADTIILVDTRRTAYTPDVARRQ